MIRVRPLTSGRPDADVLAHLRLLANLPDVTLADADEIESTPVGIARAAAGLIRARGATDIVATCGEAALSVSRIAWRNRPSLHLFCGLPGRTHRSLARSAARGGCVRFVTSSPAVATLAMRMIADPRHVRLLRPPAPTTDVGRDAARRRLGIAPDALAVFIPGQARPGSNHRLALWATSIIAHLDPTVRVIVDADPTDGFLFRFARGTKQQAALRHDPTLTDADRAAAADVTLCTADAATEWSALAAVRDSGVPVVALGRFWRRERLDRLMAATLVEEPKPRLLARAILEAAGAPRVAPGRMPDVNVSEEWRFLLHELLGHEDVRP